MADARTRRALVRSADLIERLPELVRAKRDRKRLSLRAAGDASGVHFNAISRLEKGETNLQTRNLLLLLRWVGEDR